MSERPTYFCPGCWRDMPAGEPACRHCGAAVAREWAAKSYVEKLADALQHPEPTTPLRAAWILGELRAVEAVPALLELAECSRDLFLRAAAVRALGRIGDPRALDLLRALAETGPPVLRRVAASALNPVETIDDANGDPGKADSA